jgi:ABC-type spermidine/putrescine transport system permease subunit II
VKTRGRTVAGWRGGLLWTFAALVVVFLLTPIVVIFIVSFNDTTLFSFPPTSWSLRWYYALWTSRSWREAAALSLWIALAVTVASLVIGVPAAYALARSASRSKRFVEFFLVSPMVVPVVVLAIGLYVLFAPFRLVGTPIAIFLGHLLLALPVVVVIAGAAVRKVHPSIELAARSCGASFLAAFWHVVLPSIRPAILSSGAFAFLTSFDEVVLVLFLGGPRTNTLPKRIWEAVRFELDPSLTAVASLLTIVTLLALGIAELSRRASYREARREAKP